ncbi:MAG: hypothetical protein RBU37_07155 [Myxococcota bacterium]|nr:hypothetical protein [Myxococcota bacterium]
MFRTVAQRTLVRLALLALSACEPQALEPPPVRTQSSLSEEQWRSLLAPAAQTTPGPTQPNAASVPPNDAPPNRQQELGGTGQAPIRQEILELSLAELFARRTELAGVQIRTQGRILKVNANIRAKNWIHLGDGSSDSNAVPYDLTIVSDELPERGEKLSVVGRVQIDVDPGMGIVYPLLLDEARFERQEPVSP